MSKIISTLIFFVCFSMLLISQSSNDQKEMLKKQQFGTLSDGTPVTMYTLRNIHGLQTQIIDFGATVVSLSVRDRNGKFADIVLGYDSISQYENGSSYFGAIVGRYGNRIGKGMFVLDGKKYQLSINDGVNNLHGGKKGFNKVMWKAKTINSNEGPALLLTYVSKDGEEGYPGTVTLTVTYTLTNKNELKIDYEGKTDKVTILNPTHHSYFNLTGDLTNTILDHELMINADKTTPVASGLIPTGAFADVANTPFDFRKPTKIGKHVNDADQQLKLGGGYDHNWVLNNYNKSVQSIATLYDSASGRFMEVLSDQPGLQFYCGNFLDGTAKGKNGIAYQYRTGLCLEAQAHPDSPNHANFPSVVLKPGNTYKQTTIYQFSTK